MNRLVPLCGALLILTTVAAHAGGPGPMHLTVDDCGGPDAASWTCTSNSGNALVTVASFTAPALTALLGEEATLEAAFVGVVPAWWKAGGTGSCRAASAIAVAFVPATPTCFDYFGQSPVSGTFFTTVGPGSDPQGPVDDHRIRIRTVSERDHIWPADQTILQPSPGDDVFLFTLTLDRTRSTGAGSCSGCTEAACLVFRKLILTQPVGLGDFLYQAPGAHSFITLQGGTPACPTVTPARSSSWGQVKTLYR